MPSSPPRQTWRSSAAPPAGAGPTAATEEVCTTRSTSARRHSSSTVRVPWTLMWNSSSALSRRLVVPATWNTRVDAAQRPPHRAPVGDVGHDRLDVEVLQRLEPRGRAHGHADVVAARHERARDVRADEPGRARDEGGGHRGAEASRRPRQWRLRSSPMSQVAVVTDTTHYMPRSLVEELGIHEVSLYVTFEGVTEREADIVDLDDFYARLSSSSELPSTSQPSVGDFLAVYEPLLDDGADIVSIHLSAGISGTCAAAEQARDQLRRGRDRARAHASCSTRRRRAPGLGMMAIAANSAAARRGERGRGGGGGAGAAPRAQGLVRGRHARVPAPRRTGRRRPGVARLDAEDQADPLDRVRDPPGRARAHLRPRVRAARRVPAGAPRRRLRHVLRPAHPTPPSEAQRTGRARPRDLRRRPRVRVGDGPGDRRPRRPGPARGLGHPAGAALPAAADARGRPHRPARPRPGTSSSATSTCAPTRRTSARATPRRRRSRRRRLAGCPDGGDLLDVACGFGRHAVPLARAGFRVVGVDRSEALLEEARRRADGERPRRSSCARTTASCRSRTSRSTRPSTSSPRSATSATTRTCGCWPRSGACCGRAGGS